MNQVFWNNEAIIWHSVYYPHSPYYYDDIIKYYRDLDTAIDWLEAAGYDMIPDEEPLPIISIIAAIGAGAALLLYRRKK